MAHNTPDPINPGDEPGPRPNGRTTDMSTTEPRDLPALIEYLDARLDDLGGYTLRVVHYTWARGEHEIQVMLRLPSTPGQAQRVSDALNLIFRQSEWSPHAYRGDRDGVQYAFRLDKRDTADYPAIITPARKDLS